MAMAGRTGWQSRWYWGHLPVLLVFALGCVAVLMPFLFSGFKSNGLVPKADGVVNGTELGAGTGDWNTLQHGPRERSHVDGNDGTTTWLDKRILPILDRDYKQAKAKGKKLLCAMKDPSHAGAAATSPWPRIEQLEEWGWVRDVKENDDAKDYSHVTRTCNGLAEIIGTDLTGGKQRTWLHQKEVQSGGVTYYPTGGEYANVYWPDQGILLANDNYSPAYKAANGKAAKNPFKDAAGKPLPLPKLKQWSDVNALSYASLTPAHNLRFIFRRNIQNDATKSLIKTVLKDNKKLDAAKEAPIWRDRAILTPEHKGFAALVASPNVAGVCWMLIQHRGLLGRKDIKSITVWKDGGAQYAPNLMIELEDVEG